MRRLLLPLLGVLLLPGLPTAAAAPIEPAVVGSESPDRGTPASRITESGTIPVGPASGSEEEPADEEWISLLRSEIMAFLPGSWNSARWGILALPADGADTLVVLDADLPLAPASNVKLFTSAAALSLLGPDFRFQTLLLSDGPIREGALQGDLILFGTGDPSLSDRSSPEEETVFDRFVRTLRTLGIRRIEGDLVGDASFFAGPSRAPGWNPNDFDDWFAAPVSSLSFNENMAEIAVDPTGGGARPQLRLLPAGAPLQTIHQVSFGGRGAGRLSARRRGADDRVTVAGELPRNGPVVRRAITVSDPPLYAISVFRHRLEEAGIEVAGSLRVVTSEAESRITGHRLHAPAFGRSAPEVLAIHRSPPLLEILETVNRRSHNLYADQVALFLGRLRWGPGSFEGGTDALVRFLEETAGIAAGTVTLRDGSGLSRENRATASAFVQLLAHMERSELAPLFHHTLPEAGSRQLRRMARTPAEGNLRAKTGTIRAVSALSGRVVSRDGRVILFSILANEVPNTSRAKDIEDRIGARLASTHFPASSTAPGTEPASVDGER